MQGGGRHGVGRVDTVLLVPSWRDPGAGATCAQSGLRTPGTTLLGLGRLVGSGSSSFS